jgi:hypothetical protein
MGYDGMGKKSNDISCDTHILQYPYSHKSHQSCGKGDPHTQDDQNKYR